MEALKNELQKTLEVWTNKDIWTRRLRNLRHFIVYIIVASIVITVLPMPTRCKVEAHGAYSVYPDAVVSAGAIRDCYPPNRIEFWQNPEWSFEFHWLFIPTIPLPIGHNLNKTTIHLSYPTDLENEDALIGAANNIFVGKVIGQIGNKVTQIGPRTQYTVEVALNVKGSLDGVVTVDMLGGYENGQLVTVESDDPENFLLKPGMSYLFATRYNADENWYTLIAHPNARKVLSEDVNTTIDDLRTIAENDEKVRALESVYPNEELLIADVANSNTRNAFNSLPPEAKAAAQSRADVAKASLKAAQQSTPAVQ